MPQPISRVKLGVVPHGVKVPCWAAVEELLTFALHILDASPNSSNLCPFLSTLARVCGLRCVICLYSFGSCYSPPFCSVQFSGALGVCVWAENVFPQSPPRLSAALVPRRALFHHLSHSSLLLLPPPFFLSFHQYANMPTATTQHSLHFNPYHPLVCSPIF